MNLFDIIAWPFGYVMRFCYWIAQGNYIFALVFFSLLIEIVMLPFAIKQQKNSISAARLRPKEMAIRKKYAGRNDQPTQQKMMMEIQEMQKQEGYSPFSGCLQLIIQLPIISALFTIVYDPLRYILNFSDDTVNAIIEVIKAKGVEIVNADRTIDIIQHIKTMGVDAFSAIEGFTDKITSLEDLPNLTIGGLNLAETPNFTTPSWVLIIPALTFVTYYFSMKLTRLFTYQPAAANDQQTACSNNMMNITMPLMSTFFAFSVPGAIGLYWVFRSVVSTFKQFIISKIMPLPVFTEEEYKAAEKEYNGKNPSKASKAERDPNRPKVRSLHHIDDEDDVAYTKKSLTTGDGTENAEPTPAEEQEKPETGKFAVEQAQVKKDDRNK